MRTKKALKINITWGSSSSRPVLLCHISNQILTHEIRNVCSYLRSFPLLKFWFWTKDEQWVILANLNCFMQLFFKTKTEKFGKNNKSKNSHPTPTIENADNVEEKGSDVYIDWRSRSCDNTGYQEFKSTYFLYCSKFSSIVNNFMSKYML